MAPVPAITFRFRPMRLGDALAASHWRYPGEYAIYDLEIAPLVINALLRGVLRTAGAYPLIVDAPGDPRVSVFSLLARGTDVEIGVGLRPDRMGQGLGLPLMLQGLDYARRLLPIETFSLDVATFNARAITVYERAGFTRGGPTSFTAHGQRVEAIKMTRPA